MAPSTEAVALKLAPVGRMVWIQLGLLFLLAPGIVFAVWLGGGQSGAGWELGLTAVVTLLVGTLVLAAALRREARIEGRRLRVKATIYTLDVDLDELVLDQARMVDLRERPEFRPWLKTNGFFLPGLAAGHFRNRRKERLFCLVSAPAVLYVPMADGRVLMLSFANPAAALAALRAAREAG
ncbi:MAG: hypothetical protein Kow0020_12910 [Wenzhouxiangellaceae bacterium]